MRKLSNDIGCKVANQKVCSFFFFFFFLYVPCVQTTRLSLITFFAFRVEKTGQQSLYTLLLYNKNATKASTVADLAQLGERQTEE